VSNFSADSIARSATSDGTPPTTVSNLSAASGALDGVGDGC
jgi:hypothetical protein